MNVNPEINIIHPQDLLTIQLTVEIHEHSYIEM